MKSVRSMVSTVAIEYRTKPFNRFCLVVVSEPSRLNWNFVWITACVLLGSHLSSHIITLGPFSLNFWKFSCKISQSVSSIYNITQY